MKGDQNKRSKRVKNITRENLYKIKIKEIIYKSKKNSLSNWKFKFERTEWASQVLDNGARNLLDYWQAYECCRRL